MVSTFASLLCSSAFNPIMIGAHGFFFLFFVRQFMHTLSACHLLSYDKLNPALI